MGIRLLVGETLKKVEVIENEKIIFTCESGKTFHAYHMQDCCESVMIDKIRGDIDSLIGSPVLFADEFSDSENWPEDRKKQYHLDSFTWTYQTVCTQKGKVVFEWLGTSNGYYSESVYFGHTHEEL